ncbi:myosin-crossreactive antigen [Thioalkalivibrio nitratireducens DSM 14787]|uniref:Myosin-crossreactive antigen n=1 Tax=Thioalkalivibrio nitratireducens (strain DSM 14787 / UNIQEM 213 / ALEN2) TaxID=1255043 RepID=L0DZH8_THIND|nr:oleate hydratase [Thioalkalivibrio nitratireducens]AGA34999.1 myosin-crossreactive antigen [Thioalkalivibrio nitratireducens DSM 14787]
MSAESLPPNDVPAMHYLVGGGIASLAAAILLIRDAGVPGQLIRIFEQGQSLGGSLDGSGTPDPGYLVRGGRMFEQHFACTFDLLASVPSIDSEGLTLKDEIDRFNHEVSNSSNCRLVRAGSKVEPLRFGLDARDLRDMARLMTQPEASLANRSVADCFAPSFFTSDFWFMWSTTFAFQSWHSAIELRRYFRRFVHLLPGFRRLEGILRTRYNQYDALILPIQRWLQGQGVHFETGTKVMDARLAREHGELRVTALHLHREGVEQVLEVSGHDRVFLTLGSMTEGAMLGSNDAPPSEPTPGGPAWQLWHRLAALDPVFGRPGTFANDIERTKWESFSVTLRSPAFFEHMQRFTGNEAGTGGLVTFTDSQWLLSVVLFRQPHFRDQPEDAWVFWGYGLHPQRRGNFTGKAMTQCSGDEILRELAGHLHLGEKAESLLGGARVIPCMMPYITSQFMPRSPGDRPSVIPEGARNFAVLGQYCELPDDVVFTVEYSVRSAWTAVHALTGSGRAPPPVRRTDHDPAVLMRAARTLLRGG